MSTWIKVLKTNIGAAGCFIKDALCPVEDLSQLPEDLEYELTVAPHERFVDQEAVAKQQAKTKFDNLQSRLNQLREDRRTTKIAYDKSEKNAKAQHVASDKLSAAAAEAREVLETEQAVMNDPKAHGNKKNAAEKKIAEAKVVMRNAARAGLQTRLHLTHNEAASIGLQLIDMEIEEIEEQQRPFAAAAGITMPESESEPDQQKESAEQSPNSQSESDQQDAANTERQNAAPDAEDKVTA